MSQQSLHGRAAMITGGAQGIGRCVALTLAQAGAAVVVCDVDTGHGAEVETEIRHRGGRALFLEVDVRSFQALSDAVERCVREFGSIDILVNNAARASRGAVDEIDEETWNDILSNNLTSVWRGMRCVVPHMKRQGRGAIVNLSSVLGSTGFRRYAAYSAAKGGIDALTRQAAVDLAPFDIRVNAVAPGTIMTPLNQKIFEEADDPQALIRSWNEAHPLGRFGKPEEVAEAVLFLACDSASFVTGTVLPVDGGLLVRGE